MPHTAMSQLPAFGKFDRVWVEITKSEHDHGGKGWKFGKCLWSPERNRRGSDLYGIMREVRKGDLVLHFYEHTWPDKVHESRLSGFSRVAKEYEVRTDEPPRAGDWIGVKGHPDLRIKATPSVTHFNHVTRRFSERVYC